MDNGSDEIDRDAAGGAAAEDESSSGVDKYGAARVPGVEQKQVMIHKARSLGPSMLSSPRPAVEAHQPIARSVPFRNLVRMGRAVSIRRDKCYCKRLHKACTHPGGFWLDVQFAGEQNEDGSSRVFSLNFESRRGVTNTANNLSRQLHERVAAGVINSDETYNLFLTAFRNAAKEKVLDKGGK